MYHKFYIEKCKSEAVYQKAQKSAIQNIIIIHQKLSKQY